MTPGGKPRLLLIGGGHAHVLVLESIASGKWPPMTVTLISPDPRPFYSGMVPGLLQGSYRPGEIDISLPDLCRAAGAEYVADRATLIDATERSVETARGKRHFDLLSLDIGSLPAGYDLPGVGTFAATIRPLERALDLRDRLDRLTECEVLVVGAGSGGIELALAAHRRLTDRGCAPVVTIVTDQGEALTRYRRRTRERAGEILRRRGIRLLEGRRVASVEERGLTLETGERIPAELVIWATGPAAPPLIADSGLPTTPDGYLLVDRTLRAVDGSPVWGAGDCVSLRGTDVPKAGVFAVREGPVLAENLRAAITGDPTEAYEPQGDYLSLLNTADGKALMQWRWITVHSQSAWRLKDWIDRRWIRRFSDLGSGG